MEENFKVKTSDREEYVIQPLEETFEVYFDGNKIAVIRHSLDEFERWELVEGTLEKDRLEKLGEQVERYYM